MKVDGVWIYLSEEDLKYKSLNMIVEEMARVTGIKSLKRYHVRSVSDTYTLALYSDEKHDPHFSNLEDWQEDPRLFLGWTEDDYMINDDEELKQAKKDLDAMMKLPKHPDIDYNIELLKSSIAYYEYEDDEEEYILEEVVKEEKEERPNGLGKSYLEMLKEQGEEDGKTVK